MLRICTSSLTAAHDFVLHAVNEVQNAALLSLGCHCVLLFQKIPMGLASLSPFVVESG